MNLLLKKKVPAIKLLSQNFWENIERMMNETNTGYIYFYILRCEETVAKFIRMESATYTGSFDSIEGEFMKKYLSRANYG